MLKNNGDTSFMFPDPSPANLEIYIHKFLIIFIVGILCCFINCNAKNAPGFIITEKSDTIYGQIRIYKYNCITNGFIINGIDLEWFHQQVLFKRDNTRKFEVYYPEQIQGFKFNYKSDSYIFHSYKIDSKNIFSNNNSYYRFLNLIYTGEKSFYKNITRISVPDFYVETSLKSAKHNQVFYDFYLLSTDGDLVKIEATNKHNTFFEMLIDYGFDESFITTLPKNLSFKDLENVLYMYFNWVETNSLHL